MKKKQDNIKKIIIKTILLIFLIVGVTAVITLANSYLNSIKDEISDDNSNNESVEKQEDITPTPSSNEEAPDKEEVPSKEEVPTKEEMPSKEESQESQEPENLNINTHINQIIESFTIEEKVGQLFMVTPEALTGYNQVTQAKEATYKAIEKYPVGGIIYFSDNIQNPQQITEMSRNISNYSIDIIGVPMFIGIDEEGGPVARIANNSNFDVAKFDNMRSVGDKGDINKANNIGVEIGKYLNEYGINLDFAPVADVITNPSNTVIGNRSFGTNPDLVASMSMAYAKGLESQKVHASMKHFPGHGGTFEDSHHGSAYTNKTLEELKQAELVPFKKGVEQDVKFIMVSHISAPKITGDDIPSSVSQIMINDILREEMGYDNIVITDAMNMGAISQHYSSKEASILAIEAGVDIILMPEDLNTAYNGLIEAVNSGRISEKRIDQSLERILKVKMAIN